MLTDLTHHPVHVMPVTMKPPEKFVNSVLTTVSLVPKNTPVPNVLETESISQIVSVHQELSITELQFVHLVPTNVSHVLTLLNIVTNVLESEPQPQLVTVHTDIMKTKLTFPVNFVTINVKLVTLTLILVMFALETESIPQLVNAHPDISMTVFLLPVHHVLTNVPNVTSTDVPNVVETELISMQDVFAQVDTMTMLNVNVQLVTINVLNVHLTPNVLLVPLTDHKKELHLAHVQPDIMNLELLNAQFALTNV